MEAILEKYQKVRPLIKDGDLILFHGTGLLARIIQFCDKSYYNHMGVIIEKHGSLYIVDSNASGVQADRLSWRVGKYKSGDFTILQSKADVEIVQDALGVLLMRSDIKWIKYDFFNGGKELANRKFGWNLKIDGDDDRDICSDFISQYAMTLSMVDIDKFIRLRVAFPEDYIRYKDLDNVRFIN